MLYNTTTVDRLLGCLLTNPTLLKIEKYKLDKDFFFGTLFHRYLFIVIDELVDRGAKKISMIDIDNFIEPYTEVKMVLEDNNYREYIEMVLNLVEELDLIENVEYYVNDLKKYSLLNDYKSMNYDISQFFDETKDSNKEQIKLNSFSIEDIINTIEGQQISIRRKYKSSSVLEEYKAGSDFMKTKESFKESPFLGSSFQSELLNEIFNGAYGLTIDVAKTGGGKSTKMIGDLLKSTATELYDLKLKKFTKNKSRIGGGLFINTEMDLRKEVDPLMIAFISGVSRSKIKKGEYKDDEEERVNRAWEILIESNIYSIDHPEFCCDSIRDVVKDYVLNKGVLVISFDYVADNGIVGQKLATKTKIPQRQDMILLELTNVCKMTQKELGDEVSFRSAVQSNGEEDKTEFPTESCMAGGKSQARKTDSTVGMFPITKKEFELTKVLADEWNKINKENAFGNYISPTHVYHCIKGRSSEYPKYMKVFGNFDLGNGRWIDMYCTDCYNIPVKVVPRAIEYKE